MAHKNMFRIITAAIVGNGLEVYDMVIYGYLSTTIAHNFFPKEDKLSGIASVFAVFFVGYLARPLGALFFGRIGDTLGRRPALILSIWLMALSTSSLGLLPNYAAIGMWAQVLLLLVRLLQGFSFGGLSFAPVQKARPAPRDWIPSFLVQPVDVG